MTVKVIRVLVYEGDEAAVRKAIQMSKPLGRIDCGKGDGGRWTLTIGEHLNELPPLPETVLTTAEIENAIAKESA